MSLLGNSRRYMTQQRVLPAEKVGDRLVSYGGGDGAVSYLELPISHRSTSRMKQEVVMPSAMDGALGIDS